MYLLFKQTQFQQAYWLSNIFERSNVNQITTGWYIQMFHANSPESGANGIITVTSLIEKQTEHKCPHNERQGNTSLKYLYLTTCRVIEIQTHWNCISDSNLLYNSIWLYFDVTFFVARFCQYIYLFHNLLWFTYIFFSIFFR